MSEPSSSQARRRAAEAATLTDPREESRGPVVLARLEAPLTGWESEDLLNWAQPLCTVARRLVLDLRAVIGIDIAGVGALETLHETLLGEGGELCLLVTPGGLLARRLARLDLRACLRPTAIGSVEWVELVEEG